MLLEALGSGSMDKTRSERVCEHHTFLTSMTSLALIVPFGSIDVVVGF